MKSAHKSTVIQIDALHSHSTSIPDDIFVGQEEKGKEVSPTFSPLRRMIQKTETNFHTIKALSTSGAPTFNYDAADLSKNLKKYV